MTVSLRTLNVEDLAQYEYWLQPKHAYHKLNGPYFKKKTAEELAKEIAEIRHKIKEGNENPLANRRIISNENSDLIGEVSWYWKSRETNWLELGIVIFDEQYWGKGIGTQAFELWINMVFAQQPNIVRLGISTWSGNAGMIRLAKKLGMQEEARYRKARIVDGKYFDSISFGILREEWDNRMK